MAHNGRIQVSNATDLVFRHTFGAAIWDFEGVRFSAKYHTEPKWEHKTVERRTTGLCE
jgi:hypothetical protein